MTERRRLGASALVLMALLLVGACGGDGVLLVEESPEPGAATAVSVDDEEIWVVAVEDGDVRAYSAIDPTSECPLEWRHIDDVPDAAAAVDEDTYVFREGCWGNTYFPDGSYAYGPATELEPLPLEMRDDGAILLDR